MTSFTSTEVTGLTEADISVTVDRDWGTVSTIQGPSTNQNSSSEHQFETLSSLGDYKCYRRFSQLQTRQYLTSYPPPANQAETHR